MIDRLKLYIEHRGLLSSQFADAVGMPRSSFSQLMNGRNKSINDATIVKIHTAFPDLSIQWLLFGEGSMIVNGNGGASAPSAQPNDFSATQQQQSQLSFFDENAIFERAREDGSKYAQDLEAEKRSNEPSLEYQAPIDPSQWVHKTAVRKVVKVLVFYDDNTYEEFMPR